MTGPVGDPQLLSRYEAALDPRRPEGGAIPARVLGYGEASTVLTFQGKGQPLAYKRLPMFQSAEEAGAYEALHRRYVRTLGERAGLRVAPTNTLQISNRRPPRTVVYIVQELLPEEALCNNAIFHLSPYDVGRLVMGVLQETARVFDLNQVHQGEMELGFDGEISNWAIIGFDADRGVLPDRYRLTYLDTSTPMMRRRGQEQLDLEMFLRGAPKLLLPAIRRTVMADILARYYDFRRVAVDMISQFYKEGREDLVPSIIDTANWFFLAERREHHFQPITQEEVKRYERWDRTIRRSYVWLRRVSRAMCRISGRDYPYILPRPRISYSPGSEV
jgi:hypothetical protein